VIRREGVGDHHSGVGPVHGEALVAQRVHQRRQVIGQGRAVVAVPGLTGEPDAALIDRYDGEAAGQGRHQHPPGVPALGPAVHQQERRALTAGDRMQAQVAGVDVLAGERAGAPHGLAQTTACKDEFNTDLLSFLRS
jgi:hypothetical protein